jgi:hypothetical protein
LEPKEPSSNFVASYQQHSAVQVEFHNNKDSFLRAAEILQAPTMCSRDFLQQAKGDLLDRVHSVQMVLEMIRQGRLVQRTRSSAEAKSLKTRVKGTVRLPCQLDSSRGGQTGGRAGGQVKGLLSQGFYSRGELDNSSIPNQTRAKASPPEKHFTANKKELQYALFLGVTVKKGVADDDGDE